MIVSVNQSALKHPNCTCKHTDLKIKIIKKPSVNAEKKISFFRMAPKKVEEPEKKPLIGRVGTSLKIGIVGIPNVGKSTFFNVLTKSQAAAENFPFCTIDPNENKYLFCVKLNKKQNELKKIK